MVSQIQLVKDAVLLVGLTLECCLFGLVYNRAL